jgi:hypothetical protein
VAYAVQALREAPHDATRPLLDALSRVPCSVEDVCLLRRRCVDAYALHSGALDALAAVRHAASRSDEPVPVGAASLLGRAAEDLRRSAELQKACVDLEGEVRRRYGF